jgi:voltage-gated sodium channel
MISICKSIIQSKFFQNFITGTILLSGLLVGLETYPEIVKSYDILLDTLDILIITIFIIELSIKIISFGEKFWKFFLDPWNVFDFFIVTIALLPFHAEFITVLRLIRLLRLIKLLNHMPKLQLIVGALWRSIPSIGSIGLLLSLIIYMYSVAGVFLFSKNDPFHFGNLQITFLTLFKVITMEWVDIMHIQIYGCNNFYFEDFLKPYCTTPENFPLIAPLYFITFILFGTMIILNLFIGVILQGMQEAQAQRDSEENMGDSKDFNMEIDKELNQLHQRVQEIQKTIERLKFLSSQK